MYWIYWIYYKTTNSAQRLRKEMEAVEIESLDEPVEPNCTVLTLVSSDGGRFQVTATEASISGLLRNAIECQPEARELPVSVPACCLDFVVEYMRHHNGKEASPPAKPLRTVVMTDVCEDIWDAVFIDRVTHNSKRRVYDLITVANYMHIPTLLHLSCAKVASFVKGVPLEHLRRALMPDAPQNNDTGARDA